MANIWEKAISILAGNLNSGRSYHITTVPNIWTTLKKISKFWFQSHFSASKIGWIFPKKKFYEEYLIRRPNFLKTLILFLDVFWYITFKGPHVPQTNKWQRALILEARYILPALARHHFTRFSKTKKVVSLLQLQFHEFFVCSKIYLLFLVTK